ncbi:MAG: hypothetical protein HC824_17000 [Synechococcales cyanobacterium RM1_1_8]|nr:hypothetical protein [Synechococcales cyanobacterium RM1_1_8]
MTFPGTWQQHLTAALWSASLTVFMTTSPAQALTLVRNFVGGAPPSDLSGGGNLVEVFNAAADYWEAAILDDYSLTLDYGWTPRSGNILASYSPLGHQEEDPFRATQGLIGFDNDGSFAWFADSTPREASEYQNFSTARSDYGGGELNDRRLWHQATGDAAGRYDLFTVALHEIGRGLNILFSNPGLNREVALDLDIDIQLGAFAGSSLPVTGLGGGNLAIPDAVMNPVIYWGQRRLLTEADILAVAAVSQFEQVNLDPRLEPGGLEPGSNQSIPEGSFSFALLAMGVCWGLGRRRRQPFPAKHSPAKHSPAQYSPAQYSPKNTAPDSSPRWSCQGQGGWIGPCKAKQT